MTRRGILAGLGAMVASLLVAGCFVLGPGRADAAEVNLELDSPSAMKANIERTVGSASSCA